MSGFAAQNIVPDIDYMTEVLADLCRIPSVTGDTKEAMGWIQGKFQDLGYDSVATNKGGLLISVPGRREDMERGLSAHVDTLGAMVFEVKANGRLKLTLIGGSPWPSLEGEHVVVKASNGKQYTGTILITKSAGHVWGQETTKTERNADNMEVRIDEKVKNKEDVLELGIRVGDFVVFDPRTEVTPSGFIKSRHLDDKASVAAILGCAKFLKDNNLTPAYTTHFYMSNYEEVGHGGSHGIPVGVKEFIAVDMGCIGGGLQGSEYTVSICAKDSGGPYDYDLRKKLEGICEEGNIPFVVDVFPFYGSDAGALLRAGHDVRCACVGTGVDASHSHERTHKEGLLAAARLVTSYVLSE